jgi:predicted dehydrogenase
VFGRTASKLDQVATEFGFATTTDIDSIYDDPTIDMVDVCLPTPLHADHVIHALDCGKHVLCELPLATNMDDAHRVVDAHAASDRQVFVDMAGRFDPATEVLATAIAAGTYGPLTGTITEYTDTGARELDLAPANSYTALIDHALDCLAGRATSRLSPGSVLDSLQLTLDVCTKLAKRQGPS